MLRRLKDEFVQYLTKEKCCSKRTIETYAEKVDRLIQFMERKSLAFNSFNEDQWIEFVKELKPTNSESSIALYFHTTKHLMRFLAREGHIKASFMKGMSSPRVSRQIPTVLTQAEVEAMINQCLDDRECAIIEMLYSTGIRTSELCQLNMVDLSKDGCLRVNGKGGKCRIIPVGSKAIKALTDYIYRQKKDGYLKNQTSDAMFLGIRKRISRETVYRTVKDLARRAGVTKTVSIHTMRHTFATHMVDNSCDLRVLQELMGHSSISTTGQYLHVSTAKLSEDFKKAHKEILDARRV